MNTTFKLRAREVGKWGSTGIRGKLSVFTRLSSAPLLGGSKDRKTEKRAEVRHDSAGRRLAKRRKDRASNPTTPPWCGELKTPDEKGKEKSQSLTRFGGWKNIIHMNENNMQGRKAGLLRDIKKNAKGHTKEEGVTALL